VTRPQSPTLARPRSWHGLVLAGGASSRFGRDKAFARVGGVRLIDRALASLADAEAISVMIGSHERLTATAAALPQGIAAVVDDHPGQGPLAALATAASRHRGAWLAVLAVDLPLVPRAWWPLLAERHVAGAAAVVPRDASGRWEPLAALYHGSLADDLASVVGDPAQRALGFQGWLSSLLRQGRVVAVDEAAGPEGALLNVNSRDDAQRVERLLAAPGTGT
jgi:molybdenum cofactor guanylyltransferase